MNNNGTVRLSKDKGYKRPKRTKQQMLTPEEIDQKLENYVEVDNIGDVPLNTHVRYFTIQTDKKTGRTKKLFRLGGFLINKDNHKKYVVLSNGKSTWSVQTAGSYFYKKMRVEEVKEQYEDTIEDYKLEIKRYKKEVRRLRQILVNNGIKY